MSHDPHTRCRIDLAALALVALTSRPAHAQAVGAVVDPSLRLYLAATSDGTARVFDVATGAERHRLDG